MSAAAVVAVIAGAIVELVKAGIMSRECADALCARAPVLAPVLPRLPLADYRDARLAATGERPATSPVTLADLQRVAASPSERAALRVLAARVRP